jgi:hypothetical protein
MELTRAGICSVVEPSLKICKILTLAELFEKKLYKNCELPWRGRA